MGEIAAEVERRRDQDSEELAPIYLLIYDIQRFRDLRKGDDDFGFSSSFGEDKPVSASKSFTTILKEGPAVAVHTLVWCDSVNNLNRTFDRQGLREFEIRILFQMSANDSSALIDSPVAGKLGPNRALFFSEEANLIEKFRPYGLPDPAWLDQVAEAVPRAAEARTDPSSRQRWERETFERTGDSGIGRTGTGGRSSWAGIAVRIARPRSFRLPRRLRSSERSY